MKIFNYAFLFAAVAARHCAPSIGGAPAVHHPEGDVVEVSVLKKIYVQYQTSYTI